jgi:hypothetical protein
MFARFSNPCTELTRIFGIPQISLPPFSYAKCLCFAAGAYNNKSLCNDLVKNSLDYIGCISCGAREFGHHKLADRYERLLTPTLPKKQKTISVSNDQSSSIFWMIYVAMCSLVIILAIK